MLSPRATTVRRPTGAPDPWARWPRSPAAAPPRRPPQALRWRSATAAGPPAAACPTRAAPACKAAARHGKVQSTARYGTAPASVSQRYAALWKPFRYLPTFGENTSGRQHNAGGQLRPGDPLPCMYGRGFKHPPTSPAGPLPRLVRPAGTAPDQAVESPAPGQHGHGAPHNFSCKHRHRRSMSGESRWPQGHMEIRSAG